MPKADAINNTAELEDIIEELSAGIGVLMHLGTVQDGVEPEEVNFVAGGLRKALHRLESALRLSESEDAQP